MATKDEKRALRLAPGSRWGGDCVIGADSSTVNCVPSHGGTDGTVVACCGEYVWALDALAAIRVKGADPEYLELLDARRHFKALRAELQRLSDRNAELEQSIKDIVSNSELVRRKQREFVAKFTLDTAVKIGAGRPSTHRQLLRHVERIEALFNRYGEVIAEGYALANKRAKKRAKVKG